MGKSLFLTLFLVFAIVSTSAFEEDEDFEKQFEAETQFKGEAVLKVEEVEKELFDEYDDEEFVSSKKGTLKNRNQPQQQQKQEEKQQEKPKFQQEPIRKLSSDELWAEFIPDFCIIGMIFVYICYFFVGRSQNKAVANKFGEEYGDIFRDAFLYLGTGGDTLRRSDTLKKQTDMVVPLSPTEYAILGTGHKNCAGILASIVTKSRQDVFSVVYNYFTKEKDELMIEVPMNNLERMNCLVVRKENREYYEAQHGDVIPTTAALETPEFGKEFCVVSDCDRHVISAIFQNRDVAATLRKYSKYVKSIHFTDQKKQSTHSKFLRFVYVLPDDVTQMKTILKMTLFLIDFLAQYKHSAKARQAIEASRTADKREKRQEALQQKKDKEWSAMTEEQRKKKLEREKMRKMKKRAGSMKIMQK